MSSFAFDEEFASEMNTRMNLEAAKAAKVTKVKKARRHTATQIETIRNMITDIHLRHISFTNKIFETKKTW